MYKVIFGNDCMWNEYLNKIPKEKQDIYYTSEYYKLYENKGDGKAVLFVYEEKNKIGLYPFMMNEIKGYDLEKKYFDIETAYGYGGPISNCDESDFISEFENSFIEFCNDNNIVAEFIRFHPLLQNHNLFNKDMQVLENRTTVVLDLDKSIDNIWDNQIKSKNRNMIRKAEKNGLKVSIGDDYDTFINTYQETMEKVSASDYYFFDKSYYTEMKDNNDYLLLEVKLEEVVVASALFMKYGEYFHYHLAGSKKEYLKLAPNNLLLWEAIKYANKNGYKKFHFGGGLTNSIEDPLFKFKSSFSKDTSIFYIGKRVLNIKVYDYLIKEWENNTKTKAKLLLQYREK